MAGPVLEDAAKHEVVAEVGAQVRDQWVVGLRKALASLKVGERKALNFGEVEAEDFAKQVQYLYRSLRAEFKVLKTKKANTVIIERHTEAPANADPKA